MSSKPIQSDKLDTAGLRSYLTGFILAIILTAIPFAMVMNGGYSQASLIAVIFSTAVVQMVVHLYYFLHLRINHEQRWDIASFVFTSLIVLLLVGGSIWIMYSLHHLLH